MSHSRITVVDKFTLKSTTVQVLALGRLDKRLHEDIDILEIDRIILRGVTLTVNLIIHKIIIKLYLNK